MIAQNKRKPLILLKVSVIGSRTPSWQESLAVCAALMKALILAGASFPE